MTQLQSAEAPRAARNPLPTFATQWPRYDRMLEPIELRLLETAALSPGERVIDVGCGAGTTSLDAARAVGPGGSVVGVDVDPGVIEVARERMRATGLVPLRFECADAASFRHGPVDAIVSRFGALHFEDPVAAFSNLRACLRPGGRLVLSSWRGPRRNAWATVPLAALMDAAGKSMPTLDGGPFALSDPTEVERILLAAGFEAVSLRSVDRPLYVGADVDDALEFFFETDGRKLAPLLEGIGYGRATEVLRDALSPHVRHGGVWLRGGAWIASATRPAS